MFEFPIILRHGSPLHYGQQNPSANPGPVPRLRWPEALCQLTAESQVRLRLGGPLGTRLGVELLSVCQAQSEERGLLHQLYRLRARNSKMFTWLLLREIGIGGFGIPPHHC